MSPWNLLVPLEEQLKVWSLVELHFIFQVSVSPRLSKENAKKEFLFLVFIFQATSASQAFLIGMSLDSDFGNAHAPCLFWFFQKPARVEVTLMRGFNWMLRVSKCFSEKNVGNAVTFYLTNEPVSVFFRVLIQIQMIH